MVTKGKVAGEGWIRSSGLADAVILEPQKIKPITEEQIRTNKFRFINSEVKSLVYMRSPWRVWTRVETDQENAQLENVKIESPCGGMWGEWGGGGNDQRR